MSEAVERIARECLNTPWRVEEALYSSERGGVWRIANEETVCALKVIRFGAAERAGAVAEVEIVRGMADCPYIVQPLETACIAQEDGGTLLIRMAMLEPLSQIVDAGDGLSQTETLYMAECIAAALVACHAAGYAHRDVKLQNIYRTPGGDWQLGDFGIARRLRADAAATFDPNVPATAYTPLYAAPEVLNALTVNDRLADMYALGLVLYRLVNGGVFPLGPCGQDELLRRRRSERTIALPNGCDRALGTVIWQMLQYAPEDRYHDMGDVLLELERVRSGRPPLALSAYECAEGIALYRQGHYEEAMARLEPAMTAGREAAKKYIGMCLYYGFGVAQNPDRAMALLLPFADAGDGEAAALAGEYYYSQTLPRKDYEKAVAYLRVAAEADIAEAQFRLAHCYLKGDGVTQSKERAVQWFQRAAAGGHEAALAYLQRDPWDVFDWMRAEGGEIRITRCKMIDDSGHVQIPERIEGKPVTRLGEYMFAEAPPPEAGFEGNFAYGEGACHRLRQLTLPSTLQMVEPGALYGCPCLEGIEVSGRNPRLESRDGVLYTADGRTLLRCPPSAPAETFDVPVGVAAIADNAFMDCVRLTAITLPVTLRTIGARAFAGCTRLTTLTIPQGVTAIGAEALIYCANLKALSLPDSVRSIGPHLLSRRYGTVVHCEDGSFAAMYAGENMLPRHSRRQLSEALVHTLMSPLLFAYTRHPDGVPEDSGSYRVLQAGGHKIYELGGSPLVEAIVSLFATRYAAHEAELRRYWQQYLA